MAARQVANASNIKDAREQVELALLYEPKDADAHLLRGQILLGKRTGRRHEANWSNTCNRRTMLM